VTQIVIVRSFTNWHPVVGRCRDRHSKWVRPGRTIWLFGVPVTRHSGDSRRSYARQPGTARHPHAVDEAPSGQMFVPQHVSPPIATVPGLQLLSRSRRTRISIQQPPGGPSRFEENCRERTDVIRQTIHAEHFNRHLITLGISPTSFVGFASSIKPGDRRDGPETASRQQGVVQLMNRTATAVLRVWRGPPVTAFGIQDGNPSQYGAGPADPRRTG